MKRKYKTEEEREAGRRAAYTKRNHSAKGKAYLAAYYQRNKERYRELAKINNAKPENRARKNKQTRLKEYGLKEGDLERLYEKQGRACACCQFPISFAESHVDHDHNTGAVRGLVHRKCNLSIGYLQDSAELVERAASYLRNTQPEPDLVIVCG